jgi:hypothetical protein
MAAWCFFDKGDSAVEEWVAARAVKILEGKCNQVAKGIRISAPCVRIVVITKFQIKLELGAVQSQYESSIQRT